MPKRVIDFDAMWGSDKIAACAEWAQAEYAWLYGLADPSGCFELTNLRVIWGRVAAIRRNLTIERLEQVFGEFQDKGLLFVWEQDGKRYGHWTGSDVPGRLPPPSWRMRLERLAPAVPKQMLAEYVARFARGRAASPGGGFLGGTRVEQGHFKSEISNLKKEDEPAGGKGGWSQLSLGAAVGLPGHEVQENLRFEISNLKCEGRAGRDGGAGAESEVRVQGNLRSENSNLEESGRGGLDGGRRGGEVRQVGPDGARSELDGSRSGNGCVQGGARAGTGTGRGGWSGLKGGVEESHAQDLGLGLNLDWKENGRRVEVRDCAAAERAAGSADVFPNQFLNLDSKANSKAESNTKTLLFSESNSNLNSNANSNAETLLGSNSGANSKANERLGSDANSYVGTTENADSRVTGGGNTGAACAGDAKESANTGSGRNFSAGAGKAGWHATRGAAAYAASGSAFRDKAELLARELRVGKGPPSLGPVHVKPEALERNRLREAKRNGTRSP